MTNRKQRRKASDAVIARIATLLNEEWGGSQTKMAKAIGVSQSTLSNVLSGRRAPGRELLTAIARQAKGKADWLILGSKDTTFLKIRIYAKLHFDVGKELDLKETASVIAFSHSQYFYQLSERLELPKQACAESGNLLLIETDPSCWSRRGFDWQDRVVVVKPMGQDAPQLFKIINSQPKKTRRGVLLATSLSAMRAPQLSSDDAFDSRMGKMKRAIITGTNSLPFSDPAGHATFEVSIAEVRGLVMAVVNSLAQ